MPGGGPAPQGVQGKRSGENGSYIFTMAVAALEEVPGGRGSRIGGLRMRRLRPDTHNMTGESMAGYSGTPLAKKLGIRAGHRIWWDGAPPGFAELVDAGPSVIVDPAMSKPRSYDVIVAFLPVRGALPGLVDRLAPLLRWSGGLWLAWPKLSGALRSDIREADVRRAGLESGLVDNRICAIDQNWSGLRFVYRKADRPS